MNIKKLSILATILSISLIILALLIPACSGTTTPASGSLVKPATSTTANSAAAPSKEPKKGGTFRIIAQRGPTTSIGWYADDVFRAGLWTAPLVDSLLECDFYGTVKPRLATSWEVASDLKSIKLTLRKGVKFHDGTDFNATAAKWNLDKAISGKASGTPDWSSVDIVDDYAVKINVKNYQNTMLNTLASGTCYQVSPTAFEKNGGAEGLRWAPVATGPFKLASYQKDVVMKYSKFSDYWMKDKPYVDAVQMDFIADLNTASLAFQAGNADALDGNFGKIQYDLVQKGYPVAKGLSGTVQLITDSKNADSPFSKLQVRQALDYAIDRNAIVTARGFGFQNVTYQFAFKGTPSYITNLKERSYNPDTAKKLLAEAGYPSGFKTTLNADNSNIDRDAAVAVQNFLSQVGIDADFQYVDINKSTNLKMNGWKNAINMGQLGVDANPNASLSRDLVSTSPSYPTTLKPAEFDKLVQASIGSKEFDPDLIKKVNQYMYDNALSTYLFDNARGAVLQPYVRDTGFMSMQTWPGWQPANVWLDK
jgi:peptide/nickel transport system substrate-binding protein